MTMRRATFSFGILAFIAAVAACGSQGTAAGTADAATDAAAEAAPLSLSPLAAKGRDFVVTRKCASCHQSDDPNDGILSGVAAPQPNTNAHPQNLTPDPDTGIDGWTDEALTRAMREGKDDQGDTLCPPMPRFTDMGDDEAKAIVAYLRSLPSVHHYIPDSTCPPLKPAPDAGSDAAPTDGSADGASDSATSDDAASDAAAG